MQAEPDCPTCGAKDYQDFGSRTYRHAAIAKASGWKKTALRILFEVWRRGDESDAQFAFVGCRQCGLMIYLPRPTDAEISEKYAFVNGMGDATPSKGEHPERTALRARRVFNILKPHAPRAARKVLDYGGGDGRLLKQFVDKGFDCGLLDYSNRPIAGVTRLGSTEADLAPDARFDVIVCSHVVEHLGSPRECLARLSNVLAYDGVIYVEVPYEVFNQLPANAEPVTHVNFFTPASLARLLTEAGFETIKCTIGTYPHPKGHWSLCVGAVARRASQMQTLSPVGVRQLERAIRPPPIRHFAMRAYRKLRPRLEVYLNQA